jgi:anaerobic selenocysteine-containing dehydrogenase
MQKEEGIEVKPIICNNGAGGCFLCCGLLASVDTKTGKIVKIEGNPDHAMSHGWICPSRAVNPNYPIKWLYHPGQLMHPLKRVGKRGEGKWEQIGYEQALDEIAEKLKVLKAKYGPESLAVIEGTFRSDHGFLARSRFLGQFGNPYNLIDPGTVCHRNDIYLDVMTAGCNTGDFPDLGKTRTLIIQGGNPIESFPQAYHLAIKARRDEMIWVVIDPRLTDPARIADYWLQIRPGTDGALYLTWLNWLIGQGMYDRDLVKKWTNGTFLVRGDTNKLLREGDLTANGSKDRFVVWDLHDGAPATYYPEKLGYASDKVDPSLDGEYTVTVASGQKVLCKPVWQRLLERIAPYTPEWCEKVTWIKANKIIETGKLWWTERPTGTIKGVSSDAVGRNAVRIHQARNLVAIVTNNFDAEGAVVLQHAGPVIGGKMFVRDSMLEDAEAFSPEVRKKMLGADTYRLMGWPGWEIANRYYEAFYGCPLNMSGHAMLSPPSILWRAILTGKPYPIKSLITWSGNPVAWAPNTKLAYEALKSENIELSVVLDYWMTPTAELADYVLPAASKGLEMPFVSGWEDQGPAIVVGERAIKPLGERRTDYAFFKGLAERFGFGHVFEWDDLEALADYRLKPLGLDLKTASKHGIVASDPPNAPWLFKTTDPKTGQPKGFATPSRLFEIWPVGLEELQYDPLPFYEEPPESPVSTPVLAKQYPLILTTGGRFTPMFHSENRQWGMGFREQHPWPVVDIHYETAREVGIANGDWVWIENRRGRILQKARVGTGIHPKVVNVESHWWYPEMPAEEPWNHGALMSNANILTLDEPNTLDPLTGGWCFRGLLCKVYKAEDGIFERLKTDKELYASLFKVPGS